MGRFPLRDRRNGRARTPGSARGDGVAARTVAPSGEHRVNPAATDDLATTNSSAIGGGTCGSDLSRGRRGTRWEAGQRFEEIVHPNGPDSVVAQSRAEARGELRMVARTLQLRLE